MAADTTPHSAAGEVLSLPATEARTEADLAGTPAPAYVETGKDAEQRRDVIPGPLQRRNLRGTAGQVSGLAWHHVKFHGVRGPWYVLQHSWWALRGAVLAGHKLSEWLAWRHGWVLESQAVARGTAGHREAMSAHTQRTKTTGNRWKITLAVAGVVLVFLLVMARFAPPWAWVLLLLALAFAAARHGKPKDKPAFRSATVPAQYQPPTPQIITRAMGALGITAISKEIESGRGLHFLTDVHRDGEGWGVDLDLPHGVTARMILQRREQLSAALRRPLSATWPEGVPHEHEGRLRLWIGFRDISKAPPAAYPLLRSGQCDVFAPVPFAINPRGQGVSVPLFEANWLIGAAPGEGKTSTVRVLNCDAALDPVCDLWLHELAGKGDVEPLAQVCTRYVSGLDDDSIAYAAESLRLLRAELGRRSALFKALPKEARPDGKLTRDLALKDRRLRPVVATFDEFQNAIQHPLLGKQIADDAAYVIRLGRAYGIILILATQRPASESLPTSISGVVTARFCLKVPDQIGNDLVLGTGSYRAGFNAVAFRHETDAGLGWLRGAGDPQAVRTYYLDLPATARVAARARVIRQQAGALSGHALAEIDGQGARSFAADVLAVFGTDRNLWCPTIAGRLAATMPEAYADITPEAVASQLRALGVEVKNVRETGREPRKGAERAAVEAVTR
jgi:DNA segregation ATPase FtsK/SpoIIIE, S-DNA-T family